MNPSRASTLESAISSEQRQRLVEGTPGDVLGSIGAVVVISLATYAHARHFAIATWAVGMVLVLLLQLALPRLLKHTSDSRFLTCCSAVALALGLAWAACVQIVRPDDFTHEAFVVLALCVVFTAGSVFNAAHLPMLYAFQIPGLGCLSLIYAHRGGTIDWSVAAGFAILMWTLVGYGRAFHRGLVRATELSFQNAQLVHELTAKTDALEQANAAKTRFLAAASHDLRQPLHAMSLLIGLLGERTRDQGLTDLIQRIEQSTESMQCLLNEILDISRLDAGIEHPQPTALSTHQLLERLEQQFSPIASSRSLSLRVHKSEHWILSDPALLTRILGNLVANGLQYTGRGGVLVGARARGDAVVFEVWDTGTGIPEEHLEEVFHEFVQLKSPHRPGSQGLGLGLSIVRRTAQLLGHEIEVVSRVGRGSVFRLSVARASDPPALIPQAAAPACDQMPGLRVLVIDDEPEIRHPMQHLLQAWGCTCAVAQDGAEAFEQLAHAPRPPDAIVCDYRFQEETGVELVARLRRQWGRDIPALIVTGDVTTAQLIDIASSDLPVMHKPVRRAALHQWLSTVAMAVAVAVQ